ncbi:MAG: PA0069 family radical SAM protein [Bacteroidetes bacterium]|nr:PA0069 family radical SAM protein [Bacteroidota bacterium]
MQDADKEPIKGRGAQSKPHNPFLKQQFVEEHIEGIDEPKGLSQKTQYFIEAPKKIINKISSPDLNLVYSMNPYQGCEHGCVYCYARNSHTYWGFDAGMDFESKIIVKKNAAEVFEKQLMNPKWEVLPIMLSGNTDCYQPVERKFQLTRKILEVALKFKQPISIITKNSMVTRDIDILSEMAKENLIHVNLSITSLSEETRLALEPRTASGLKRLKTLEALAKNGIPVRVMAAPIIPGLNSHEIPAILKAASEHGAKGASYIIVRLNGQVGLIFTDWIKKTFPDKADKVLHQIQSCHGGSLNDSRFGTRMKGEGKEAEAIASLFKISYLKYFKNQSIPPLNTSAFKRPGSTEQLSLF